MQKKPHIVVSGSLVLFFQGQGMSPVVYPCQSKCRRNVAFLCNFCCMASKTVDWTKRPITDIRYMCLVVVARRLKNLMTSCLKILTAGQMLMD